MIERKKAIRDLIRERKKEYDRKTLLDKSVNIFNQIESHELFYNARNILCYWAMSDEVSTHDFIETVSRSKNIFLPVVAGDDLLIRRYNGAHEMAQGNSFSILEPNLNCHQVTISEIDLVLVPGIAFDHSGGRLGRGKGYYDRLLANYDRIKIGVCFDFQIIESVPTDEHDILMDKVFFG